MGRRGGRSGRGARDEGGFEDQYGEAMQSQDRDRGHQGQGGGGLSHGGDAGSSSRAPELKVASHVPAFLRQHAHLLHGKARQATEPVIDTGPDDDSDFERDDGGALERAIAENPALAAQDSALQRRADKGRAEQEKAAGNRAFGAKEYEKAIGHFSLCIRLDPDNEVYYSNRSAALLALGRHREALADGRRTTELRPSWAKGFARVGAAFFALEQFTEAKDAYRKAFNLEPDDAALADLMHRAEVAERKALEQRKHRFRPGGGGSGGPAAKRAKTGSGSTGNGKGGTHQSVGGAAGKADRSAEARRAPLLSFGDEGE